MVVFLVHSAASHLLAHFSSFVLNLQAQLWNPQIFHLFRVPFGATIWHAVGRKLKRLLPNMKMAVMVSWK